MCKKFEAEIKAGGYPTPTYRGPRSFSMEVDTAADESEMMTDAG